MIATANRQKASPSTATGIPNAYDCGLVVTLVQLTSPDSEHPASADSGLEQQPNGQWRGAGERERAASGRRGRR